MKRQNNKHIETENWSTHISNLKKKATIVVLLGIMVLLVIFSHVFYVKKQYETIEGSTEKYSTETFDTYANDTANVSKESLQNFSNTFYGIFLAVASAVTVIVGLIIGIKYMLSSVGERANVKQMLIPYVVGCVVVYGSFGIWALVVSLLDSM